MEKRNKCADCGCLSNYKGNSKVKYEEGKPYWRYESV